MTKATWPHGIPSNMPAQDRGDITELYARYAWGIDLADEALALSVFAPDGSFDHLWQGTATGHDAIRASLRALWHDRQHWWYGRQHLFNHFIMEPTEDGARVRCFFQILQFNVDYGTNFVFGIGTRDDRLIRQDGRWLFSTLFVNAWTSADQVPWKAERKIAPRPRNEAPPADTRPFSQS